MTLGSPGKDFADMLAEAFEVNTLEDIPGRIRTQSRGVSGRQTLVYVRHRPVEFPFRLIKPKTLKGYLEWWDACFAPLLKGDVFALLGVSFVVKKPNVFLEVLTEKERINDLPLDWTVLQVLDEMEKLAKKDLLDFLQTHNIPLPRSRRDRVVEEILEQTGGEYDMTLEALKDIAARAWAPDKPTSGTQPTAGDEDNYD